MVALSLAAVILAAAPQQGVLPVVSVLYFDNESKDPELEFMRKGLADLLITDLVAWEGVKVVERTRLEDVLKELDFQQTKYVDKKTAAKLGQVLGSSHLIYGSMLLVGGKLTITSRIVSGDGTVVATVREQDEKDKIFDLEQRLANQLIAQIDSKLSPNAQARRKAKVPDLSALIAYSKALDLADQGKIDEAQAAFRAVVSKAPTFLLARERQQEHLKAYEEYQKRKKDLIVGSVIELGKLIDEELKAEPKFDSMSEEQKGRFLVFRVLKGRFLARVLKQSLSNRASNLRVVKVGEEAKALQAMRNWVENQRKLMAEFERGSRQHAQVAAGVTYPSRLDNFKLSDRELTLLKEANFGEARVISADFMTLAEFVLTGRLEDGEWFWVAPLLSVIDPKENKAVRDELDARIKAALARHQTGDKQAEYQATQLLNFKASIAIAEFDADAAVVTLQQILDNFPAGNNSGTESKIKDLLEGDAREFNDLESWNKAKSNCDDAQAINVASVHYPDSQMRRYGLKALDDLTAEMEKACKLNNKNAWGFAYLYQRFADDAARHDDCNRCKVFWKKFLDAGGEPSTVQTNNKAFHPWCDLTEVQKGLTWFHIDGDMNGDFPRWAHAIRSGDGTVITIGANTDGPRLKGERFKDDSEESFDLRLEKQKDSSFVCASARWRYRDGKYYEGTCKVTITKWAPEDAPGFDQGTFTVELPKFPSGDFFRSVKLKGDFRVKRER